MLTLITEPFDLRCGRLQVQQLQLRDMRNLSGSSAHIQGLLTADHHRLSAALREIVFRNAPSARR